MTITTIDIYTLFLHSWIMKNQDIAEFRHALRRMERFLFNSLKGDGECCGVTFNECHILLELLGSGRITMTDLSRRLGMDKSIISRSVDLMVKNGHIHRMESPEDRRRKTITLTDLGRGRADAINTFMNRKYRTLFQNMEESEIRKALSASRCLESLFEKWTTVEPECRRGGIDVCCG